MGAALLGDEQAGDLALHPRRHHDCAWFCQRLHARRSIGRIAVNLTCRIDHYRAGFDPMRALSAGLPEPAFLRLISASERWMERAARAARSASFSCATG